MCIYIHLTTGRRVSNEIRLPHYLRTAEERLRICCFQAFSPLGFRKLPPGMLLAADPAVMAEVTVAVELAGRILCRLHCNHCSNCRIYCCEGERERR